MRIAVCDDNSIDLKAMGEVFRRAAPAHTLDTFSEGSKLLDAISGGRSYDLLFLDIMPEITGMELARKIAVIAPDIPVVFLTDSDAYAVEAFSVRALHYILKPMTEQSLKECLNRLEERRSARRRVYIVSSSGDQHMFFADELQYAECDAHYYDLHLKNGMVIRVRMTQKEIRDTLGDSFLMVSRGLVVNVEFIRQLGPKSCILKDGREILLSHGNTEEIHSAYAAYVFSQLSERRGASPDGTKQS
ncbi:MAG: response regulator transcription factor [Clostridia bacterium]|nr:response regulator transcription factor [Clostridia bacterium]